MAQGGKLPPDDLWSQDFLCPFSFPGGKCDPDDQDIIHTALRETQEELGLEVSKEHVWGVLQPVYDRVSHPHLVTLTQYPTWPGKPALLSPGHGPGRLAG